MTPGFSRLRIAPQSGISLIEGTCFFDEDVTLGRIGRGSQGSRTSRPDVAACIDVSVKLEAAEQAFKCLAAAIPFIDIAAGRAFLRRVSGRDFARLNAELLFERREFGGDDRAAAVLNDAVEAAREIRRLEVQLLQDDFARSARLDQAIENTVDLGLEKAAQLRGPFAIAF